MLLTGVLFILEEIFLWSRIIEFTSGLPRVNISIDHFFYLKGTPRVLYLRASVVPLFRIGKRVFNFFHGILGIRYFRVPF